MSLKLVKPSRTWDLWAFQAVFRVAELTGSRRQTNTTASLLIEDNSHSSKIFEAFRMADSVISRMSRRIAMKS